MRFELVRSLGRSQPPYAKEGPLAEQLARWRFAFEHGDLAAGYLLAAHHMRIQSHQQHDTLLALYRRVPTDDSLGIAVARSFSRRKEFDRARTELEKIARRGTRPAEDIKYLLEQVEDDRARDAEDKFRAAEGFKEGPGPKNLVERRKVGVRIGVGTDVRGTSGALYDLGIYGIRRLGKGLALGWRVDWTQYDDDTEEVDEFAGAVAVSARVLSTRRFEIALGAGPRFQVRSNSGDRMESRYNRAAIAGDAMLGREFLQRSQSLIYGTDDGAVLRTAIRSSNQ
jgi:hypothetical protein